MLGDTSRAATFGNPFGTQVMAATLGYLWGHMLGDTSRAAAFGNLWGRKFGLLLLRTFGATGRATTCENRDPN